MTTWDRVELLAPAGGMERLEYALHYGADAVYTGAKKLSLRAFANNFDLEELKLAADYTHMRNKKIYLTLNAFMHNCDLPELSSYCRNLAQAGVDALIVSDPAAIVAAKQAAPDLELHLSTQANTLNYMSAKFWYDMGVSRVILGREVSIDDIKIIRENTPDELEIEYFVHGAMCMSYSGRCLLSNYIDGRDGNQGACIQPCRWGYEFREKGKDGNWHHLEEDARGTYLFNANDLNLLKYIENLVQAGVTSLKIEGRMKTPYYVATVVNAYRMAIDALKNGLSIDASMENELNAIRHRPYSTGFALGDEKDTPRESQDENGYEQGADFVAIVMEYDEQNKRALIQQRNKFIAGETLEILSPGKTGRSFVVEMIQDEKGNLLDSAPHPKQMLWISLEDVQPMDILRKPLQINTEEI